MRHWFSLVALALALAVTAGDATAKSLYADEVAAICARMQATSTLAGVKEVQDQHADIILRRRELFRHARALQDQRRDGARIAYEKAAAEEKAVFDLWADLMNTTKTQALQEEQRQARMALAKVELKAQARATVQKSYDETFTSGGVAIPAAADARRRHKADLDRLDAEIQAEMPAATRRRDDADKAIRDREKAIRETRPKLDPANDKEAAAKQALEKAALDLINISAEFDMIEDALRAVAVCGERRRAELQPGSELAHWVVLLDAIERLIASGEKRRREIAADCASLRQQAGYLEAHIASVTATATALANAPKPDIAAISQAHNAVKRALDDAKASAALIAQAGTRATRSSADACRAAQPVRNNPRGADAPGQLVEAQRHRVNAEQEVFIVSTELQRIRAAHASARGAEGAVLNKPGPTVNLSQLTGMVATLKGWLHGLQGTTTRGASFAAWVNSLKPFIDSLAQADPATPWGQFVALRRERANGLTEGYKALKDTPDCYVALSGTLVRLQAQLSALDAMVQAIGSPAPIPQATNHSWEIEPIYDAARTAGDAIAADVTNAVRCVAAATNAFNNPPDVKPPPPPPPPVVTDGIKCRYKRPDGSTIEVTIYDDKTCPKDIPAKFVDWKPEAKPDVMQGFGGKWVGRDPQLEHVTISGGENVFSLVRHWRSEAGPSAAKHDWTGDCKRLPSETNAAECKVNGKYWDPSKNATYTATVKLSLQSDGKFLHCSGVYDTVEFRTNAGEPRRHNDTVAPGRPPCSGSWRR